MLKETNCGQIVLMEKGEFLKLGPATAWVTNVSREIKRLTDDKGVLNEDVFVLIDEVVDASGAGRILQIREKGNNELLQPNDYEVISASLSQICKEHKVPYVIMKYGYTPICFANEVCWLDPLALYGWRFYVLDSEVAESLKAEV